MAYMADLITVLKSLFEKVTQPSFSKAPKVTRQALTEVHQTHQTSDTRQKIYRRLRTEFLTTARDLSFMLEVFRSLLLQSLGFDPMPPPSRPTDVATSRPARGPPPPTNAVMPPKSDEEAALEPNPNVWSRFIGCLTHPTEMATSSSVTQVTPPSPPSVGVLNITLKSRKAPRTASPQSTSPPFWRDQRP